MKCVRLTAEEISGPFLYRRSVISTLNFRNEYNHSVDSRMFLCSGVKNHCCGQTQITCSKVHRLLGRYERSLVLARRDAVQFVPSESNNKSAFIIYAK